MRLSFFARRSEFAVNLNRWACREATRKDAPLLPTPNKARLRRACGLPATLKPF